MPDQLYVRARAALLDAVEALRPQLSAVVLVGAQAIYLHTGDADLTVAEYTTDADFALSPTDLADTPLLADLLTAHEFTARQQQQRTMCRLRPAGSGKGSAWWPASTARPSPPVLDFAGVQVRVATLRPCSHCRLARVGRPGSGPRRPRGWCR